MKINLHLHPSGLLNASRIQKTTGWLLSRNIFDRVYVLGIRDAGLPAVQRVGKHACYIRLKCVKGDNARWVAKMFHRLVWFVRVLSVARRLKPVCVNAHSLAVLPCAVLIKWMCGAKLVYDTHELETEVKTATGFRKKFAKIVERVFLPFADQIIVVSGSIADWYQQTYQIPRPHVVRNIPSAGTPEKRARYLREYFSIPETDIIALYLGGLIAGRGIDEILDAWKKAPSHWHLVIVGFGPLIERVQQHAREIPRIHLHAVVPTTDVVKVASSADVGFSLLAPCCLSHAYALPNKLFEYLLAGVPVITNGLPEIKRIIEQDECGWIMSLDRLSDMFEIKRDDISQKSENAQKAAKRYDWTVEAENLVEPYKALGFYRTKGS